ncbi:MAG: diaminopimelate epimerase [Clostridia bacterium]|nr:diaminopimelate epimerase [Clostridia bacterium]
MRFTKMHGIGNDFIILDGFRQAVESPDFMTKRLCDRHFGVGADGVILALPSSVADARMRIFNTDGGEPEMCGNGIRCLGKFLYDSGLVPKPVMTVETLAGVLTLTLDVQDGAARAVTVDMGVPRLGPADIPVDAGSNAVRLEADGRALNFFCVSMGNPHAVTFDLWPDDAAFYRLGPLYERHPAFPRRANVEFCRVRPDGGVDVRVWERGDGETLACGTGACAVVVAGASQGLLPRRADVHLPGGTLGIRWAEDGHVFMTGPAETVFVGELTL